MTPDEIPQEILDMTLPEFIEWCLKGGIAPNIEFVDVTSNQSWSITLTNHQPIRFTPTKVK